MEYWEPIQQRGIDTVAVWNEHDAGFLVGPLDVATHQADVESIEGAVSDRDEAEDEYDEAIDAKDENLKFIAGINTRAIGVLRGALDENDLLQKEIDDVKGMPNQGGGRILARGRKLVTVWTKINVKRGSSVPALLALTLGPTSITVAQVQTAITDHEGKLQTVATKLSGWNSKRNELKALCTKVDRNNKRWYEAWAGNFPEGSAEHEALSQINTGAAETEVPGPVTFSVMFDSANSELHIDAEAEHASHFRELRKGPGESEFVERAANAESPLHDAVSLPGVYEVKVQGRNSAGDGPVSAGQNVTVT